MTTGMRTKVLIGSLALYASVLLLGFLLGAATHPSPHKTPAIIRFEPARQSPRLGPKSPFTYPGRVA